MGTTVKFLKYGLPIETLVEASNIDYLHFDRGVTVAWMGTWDETIRVAFERPPKCISVDSARAIWCHDTADYPTGQTVVWPVPVEAEAVTQEAQR